MSLPIAFTDLIAKVAREPDSSKALQEISRAALGLTKSQHVLVAVLNEEIGELEGRAGAGDGFGDPGQRWALSVGGREGIVGYVAATGATVVTGNVHRDSRYLSVFPSTQSEMAVPVTDHDGRIRGVLNLEADALEAYEGTDTVLACALADLVMIVLEREAHLRREEALMRVGGAVGSAVTETDLIEQVIRVAEDVLRLQACSIFLIEPSGEKFVLRSSTGRLRDLVGQISYDRGEGFTGWVCDTGQPILLDNPQGDPRWRGKYVEFPSEQVASFLAVPIVWRGRGIGAIRALRRKSDNPFYDNRFRTGDMRLLAAIAEQLAIGLESVRSTERTIRGERMIAWGELSAKSSHMIGNRVFALKGDLNELRHLLAESSPSADELRELERSVSTNVRRIEEILQDFRDFVTATQLSREPTDLNTLVRETLEEVFPRRSSVQLETEYAADLPEFGIDGKRLRRAVSELIENSLSYMDKGGRLSVSTSVVDSEDNERLYGASAHRFAQIVIQDTGPGVESGKKTLIFQPFYSGRVRGMGLGLSIVKGIVDAHGGQVYEAGEPGEGAKFVILLPLTT
ncbi:GAF domain-containing protein [Fimbriimonas ginsengisoli]|uniref:histidine kinase n=1 Tax=Fimbriimonas ginsengisoli Gsoil 348 TaxID=661478 RepID=A0A068NV17_FIMGI|nr:GAF domain-containing protein [Fimbriimonas ginsengisoli]AIE87296.1 multi-sensor signal transduction histidine kinase [Fimbriimonas ginsengisoli Gsoil 348]